MMEKPFYRVFLILAALLIGGCATGPKEKLQVTEEEYFARYGLNRLSGVRSYGRIGTGGKSLWTWSVTPPESSQTVVFLHGYLDHSALSLSLFEFLNKRNYRIIAFDLPGHGLSGGERGGLENFEEYRNSLDRIMAYWNLNYEDTLFVGHSTGGAILLDKLLRGQSVKGVILAAPLVRFSHFGGAVFLLETLFRDKESIKVSRRPTTSNGEYNKRKEEDPLGIERIPLDWSRAIVAWEKSLPEGEIPCETPLLVVQGREDRVVSYGENIPRIGRWFPETEIRYYPGLKHTILNEAETEGMYGDIMHFLLSLPQAD